MTHTKKLTTQSTNPVNFYCYCKKKCLAGILSDPLVFLFSCNHFIHKNCLNNQNTCPLCNSPITKIFSEEQIIKSKHKQNNINLRSLNFNKSISFSYNNCFKHLTNLDNILNLFYDICYNPNVNSLDIVNQIISLLNINITISDNTNKNPINIENNEITWKKKIDIFKKITIIANHSNILDSIILFKLFNCRALANDYFSNSPQLTNIKNIFNLVTVKQDNKNIIRIQKCLNKHNRILVYPEGVYNNGKSIYKFKTGSFVASDYVCPTTVKYEQLICNELLSPPNFLLDVLSLGKINVTVYISDLQKGPFTSDDIENIRTNMAKNGNFYLSNVLYNKV